MTMMRALLIAALVGACAPDVPRNPTWIEDVRPILAANCIRCHSVPQIGGSPGQMRLDTYETIEIQPGYAVDGAQVYAHEIATRVAEGIMPPRFPLTDRQVDILEAWDEADAPRGERPGNQTPEMTFGDLEADGTVVSFDYSITDADDDIVTGVLYAEATGADPVPVAGSLFGGNGSVRVDISDFIDELVAGDVDLTVELNDGVEIVSQDLDSVRVMP